jgi:uncharacterized protein (DUF2336 family)
MTTAQREPLGTVGRRRQAMLERAEAPPLTTGDVAALAEDRSEAGRMAIARKLGAGLDRMADEGQTKLAGAVLSLLARDVARCVREVLAEAVAASPHLPRETALVLAADDITVARPILEGSPVLEDEDLIRIVRTNATQYALAVAARSTLSTAVTDSLVETGEREVVASVVGNAGAVFSPATLRRVAVSWAGDPALQERLVRRPALPFELVEQLVGAIAERLEWDLVRSRSMSREEARELVRATRDRAAIAIASRDRDERGLERAIRDRLAQGTLGPDDLLALLRDGDVASFEIALAVLADIEPQHCRLLIYHDDRRHLAALCLRAALPTPHYVGVRMALQLAQAAVSGSQLEAPYGRDTIRFLQEQYERLRGDDALIDRLLGDEGGAPA